LKANFYVVNFIMYCILGIVFFYFVELIEYLNQNLLNLLALIVGVLIISSLGVFFRRKLFTDSEKANKKLLYVTKSGFLLTVILLTLISN
jgi:hypothetical protein